MKEPELTDDMIIELAREGGLAYIPKLSGTRRIVIAQLTDDQRQRLDDILRQSLPLSQPPGEPNSPGRGDQRFYRLQIIWNTPQTDLQLLIPENKAPKSLVELWRDGQACICKT